MTEDATPKPVLEALCAFVRNGTISMVINDKDAPATDIGVTCRFVQNCTVRGNVLRTFSVSNPDCLSG